jgi:hypothetical protein
MTTNTASPARTATPWGRASVVERARVPQRVGDKHFASLFELLETDEGRTLVRIAYTTDGAIRRGPVTLREQDVRKLREALRKTPALAAALGLGGDA